MVPEIIEDKRLYDLLAHRRQRNNPAIQHFRGLTVGIFLNLNYSIMVWQRNTVSGGMFLLCY
jgi:hypothetical protein